MKRIYKTPLKLATLSMFPLFLAACGGDPTMSFSQDIKPIIDKNCIHCHQEGGQGDINSGFDMSSYEKLMRGGQFGPMIIAGDVEGSNMLVLMEGRADPSISMPHGEQKPVPAEDIAKIRLWIAQGANNN